jgi:alpha-tubulin suppressor-like RCC1 family protein
MTFVYVYGSGECDELGLGDDVLQVKKPRKIPLFSLGPGFPANKIIKLACGG